MKIYLKTYINYKKTWSFHYKLAIELNGSEKNFSKSYNKLGKKFFNRPISLQSGMWSHIFL